MLTITNFNLNSVLTDVKVTEEVDMFGDTWRHKERQISEGITLFVYDSGQAALVIGEHVGIEFLYTEDVAEMFDNLAEVKALDLLAMLVRNEI